MTNDLEPPPPPYNLDLSWSYISRPPLNNFSFYFAAFDNKHGLTVFTEQRSGNQNIRYSDIRDGDIFELRFKNLKN